MPSLIYVADPMCSWCYGFTRELAAVLEGIPDLPLEIIVGGLRAYNRKVLDEELRNSILGHWKKVEQASGLPFNREALAKPDFVYDTEPACRAVVAVRALSPANTLYIFHAIQHAFYAQGADVTQPDILSDVVFRAFTSINLPEQAAAFRATWESDEIRTATAKDFEQTRHWNISGFPTLILERDGMLDLVSSGYLKAEQLVERLQQIIDDNGTAPQ